METGHKNFKHYKWVVRDFIKNVVFFIVGIGVGLLVLLMLDRFVSF